MTKLARYLKPFLAGLLLTVILLLGQAFSELNLPNYMSQIVNVGIQQNGIEAAAPDALTPEGFRLMTTFMTEPEKDLIGTSYQLVPASAVSPDGRPYSSLYPRAAGELYVRQAVDSAAQSELDGIFSQAALTMMNVLRSQMTGSQTTPAAGDTMTMDLTRLYQLQPMLDQLPPSVITQARELALASDPTMGRQTGTFLVKAFYTELGRDLGALQTAYILRIGLFMLGIALLGGLASVLVSLLSSRIAAGVARNLRKDVFSKIEHFSNAEFDRFSTASLITRCTNDITQIQQLLTMGIRMIAYAPIMGIGGVIMALDKSVSMSWIIAVASIVLIGFIMIVMSIALPKFKLIQKLVDRLNLVSRENLTGLMVIRAFGTEEYEKQRFGEANSDLTRTNLFVNRIMSFMMPVMMLIMNGVTLLILWVGAHQIADSAMQVGDMMAFMQYAMQIIMAFLMISMMFIFVPRAAVSAARISEVLETPLTVVDPVAPVEFDPAQTGLVEFRNVHFRYHNAEEDALCDITFTARPGETTALIGSTGSGKSTIANLLLRFYDVTQGQILVSGVDIRSVRQTDLRARIGYVPQKGALLTGTIASNLKYGRPDAPDEVIETAARVAQATEFIADKPEGFAAEIAQDGVNVSGGQRQRLSIARALVKAPDILIFDDSFSALDFKTDRALRQALKDHAAGSTVIVVAQRVSTILTAEQIIVLDEGRIVGAGTHRELLKTCPQYQEIASSQLSQEELA